MASPKFCDVTLREGEQSSDAAFTIDQKVAVARLLEALRVDEVQVGFPDRDAVTVQRIKSAGITVALQLLCPAFLDGWQDSFDRAIASGADTLAVLIRSSDRHLEFLGMSRAEAVARTVASISYIRERGSFPVFTPSYSSQADRRFLIELCQAAAEAGAQRVVLTDSVGVLRPFEVRELVRDVVAAVREPVGIHCHDDFGLATANTLEAVIGGATWLEVSVNGLGERAGNASIDEVAMALECLYGAKLKLRTRHFVRLSQTVARSLRIPVPDSKPIVGANAFAQKLDLHVRASATHPEMFEPFHPQIVGNRRVLRLGKGSGPYAVRAKLSELGMNADEAVVGKLVEFVNSEAERTNTAVADDTFEHAAKTLGEVG